MIDKELSEQKKNSIDELNKTTPILFKGTFWMFVGVTVSIIGTIWLFGFKHIYYNTNKPPAFFVAIAGFIIYVFGRILSVIQKSKKSKKDSL